MGRIFEIVSFHRVWSVVVPLIISVLIRGALIPLNVTFPGGQIGDLVFIAIVWAVGFLVVKIPTISSIFSLGKIFIKIDGHAEPPGRTEIINLVRRHFESFEQELSGVLGPTGAPMDKSDMDYFTTTCFRLGSGIYNGVESHLPSEFYDLYPDYLEAQVLNLEKNPRQHSSRILLATRAALRADYLKDKNRFESFFKWHQRPNVKLLYVHPKIAGKLALEQSLQTTDIGIWENQYALLFKKEDNSSRIVLFMIPQGNPTFDKCVKYVKSLNQTAKEVTCPPELVDANLATRWDEYVNPEKRNERLGEFLIEWLKPYKQDFILDAATGIGCESVFLLNPLNNFKVISNELEPTFRNEAVIYARKHGNIRVKLDGYNWLELSEKYANFQFGAILVLGNSLCLLLKAVERENAIKQFSQILKPGGILIVDERNFEYMLRNKNYIMENPPKNFAHFGKSMYYGGAVMGCPIDITPEKVTWACYSNGNEVANWESLQKNTIGEFELYPFKKGELISLLENVGQFKNIQTFSDFKQGYNPEAEFFTYIAKKPS